MVIEPTEPDRVALVSGDCSLQDHEGPFSGRIEFRKLTNQIIYEWRFVDANGKFLALRSAGVSAHVIPPASDPYDFALQHALEGIRRYRINRKHVYHSVKVHWDRDTA